MKLFTRIKLFGKKTIEDLMPIDNITQLEEMMSKQQKVLEETQQKYYNSKGKEDYYETEIKRNKKLLKDTMSSAKKAKDKNDEVKLKKLYEIKTLTETKIKTYEECLEKQKEITNQLNTLVTNAERKVTKIKCDIELLKTKEDFSKSVEDFKSIQTGVDDINIDDITKDIEINFNAKSYEFNDMDVVDIEDDGFDDFVKGL